MTLFGKRFGKRFPSFAAARNLLYYTTPRRKKQEALQDRAVLVRKRRIAARKRRGASGERRIAARKRCGKTDERQREATTAQARNGRAARRAAEDRRRGGKGRAKGGKKRNEAFRHTAEGPIFLLFILFANPCTILISITQILCRRGGVGKVRCGDRFAVYSPPVRVFKCHTYKIKTRVKCPVSNSSNAIRYCNALQAAATRKHICPDRSNAVRNNEIRRKHSVQIQIMRIVERICVITLKIDGAPCRNIGNIYAREAATTVKRRICDKSDTIRDGDARQTVTPSAIKATLSGMVTLVRLSHQANA